MRTLLLGPIWIGVAMGAAVLLAGCPDTTLVVNNPQEDMAGPPPMGDPTVRIANFTVGAPGFDVCVKGSADNNFQGPLIRNMFMRNGGIPYANASGYFSIAAASYSVRVVGGMAKDCSIALARLPDLGPITLDKGRRYTVAAMGTLNAPKIQAFGDDLTVLDGQVRMRFLNACHDVPSFELGFGSGGSYTAQISGAAYGATGTTAGGKTFLATAPLNMATLSLRQTGMASDALVLANKVTLPASVVATAAAIGIPGDMVSPLELVLCNDTAPPTVGLSACQELQ